MSSPPPTILVVEDDVGVRDIVRRILEGAGYRVEVAADAAAGLARIEQGAIDLVLLDRMLPDLDGLRVCRIVRERTDDVYLPIVMLTGLAAESDRHTGFVAGADDYITKPFQRDDLLDRVQVWLRARGYLKNIHARQQNQETHEKTLLAESFATTQELIRLLTLLLRLMECEAKDVSSADLARLRAEMQRAAKFLATRINSLTFDLPVSPPRR
jgi:DNA-binding response OmpR family regulator